MSDELTPDQKKALFEAYEKARAKATSANAAVDVAVKNIADQIGMGPFRWQGTALAIAKRGERLIMRANNENIEEIG